MLISRKALMLLAVAALILPIEIICAEEDYSPPAMSAQQILEHADRNLEEGNIDVAYYQYLDLLEMDPDNRVAMIGLADAASRSGRFEEALQAADEARQKGVPSSDLVMAEARSLYGLGELSEALVRVSEVSPETADSLELKGVILYQKDDLAGAKSAFEAADSLQPGRPAVALYLGSIAALTGDRAAARTYLSGIARTSPDQTIAERALSMLYALDWEAAPTVGVGWVHRWGAGLGYDSNVIGIGSAQLLPSDISSKHAYFADAEIGGLWRDNRSPDQTLFGGYQLNVRIYEGLGDYNQESLKLFAGINRPWTSRYNWGIQAATDQYFLGEKHFLSSWKLIPSVDGVISDTVRARLFLSYSIDDYKFAVPLPTLDRSGNVFDAGIAFAISPKDRRQNWIVGYQHGSVNADGADYDSDVNSLFVKMTSRASESLLAEVTVGGSWWDYDNLNSRTGFTTRRDDTLTYVGATLRWLKPDSKLRPYASWNYYNNRSNINLFDYSRSVVSIGVNSVF